MNQFTNPVRVACWAIVTVLGTALASCDDDEGTDSSFLLEDTFRLEGTASGTSDTLTIDCLCDLIVEIDSIKTEADGRQIYRGTHGGHFSRRVLGPSGAGIALVPDVFGEIIIRQTPQGSIDFEFPANHNTGSRFWDSIGHFSGSIQGELVSGEWICAPFDTREDSSGIVSGTWELVPY